MVYQQVPEAPSAAGALQVKTMFVLSHPVEALVMNKVQQNQYYMLLQAWRALFGKHPWWEELRRRAASADYDAVAQGLSQRFD